MTLFKVFADDEVKMRSLGWGNLDRERHKVRVPSWTISKDRGWITTRQTTPKIENEPPASRRVWNRFHRVPRRNQPCWHLNFGHPASRTRETMLLPFSATQFAMAFMAALGNARQLGKHAVCLYLGYPANVSLSLCIHEQLKPKGEGCGALHICSPCSPAVHGVSSHWKGQGHSSRSTCFEFSDHAHYFYATLGRAECLCKLIHSEEGAGGGLVLSNELIHLRGDLSDTLVPGWKRF